MAGAFQCYQCNYTAGVGQNDGEILFLKHTYLPNALLNHYIFLFVMYSIHQKIL
jgi:hypothetical protein